MRRDSVEFPSWNCHEFDPEFLTCRTRYIYDSAGNVTQNVARPLGKMMKPDGPIKSTYVTLTGTKPVTFRVGFEVEKLRRWNTRKGIPHGGKRLTGKLEAWLFSRSTRDRGG